MKSNNELIEFFSIVKKFDNDIDNEVIIPIVMNDFFEIMETKTIEEIFILLYCLDDDSKRLDITWFICDGIISQYLKNANFFFFFFLENVKIIYPHATNVSIYILQPILKNNPEARKLLCESLESADKESLSIFKEIYLLMIEEDNTYSDECILSKLNMTSS